MMRQTHHGMACDLDPALEVKRLAGTIAELWRYPVKSMLGSTVSEIIVTENGALGDRAWALRDQHTGRIVSAKRVPGLLQFRATYKTEPTLECPGIVRIETPDGETIYAGQGKCLRAHFGHSRSPGTPGELRPARREDEHRPGYGIR